MSTLILTLVATLTLTFMLNLTLRLQYRSARDFRDPKFIGPRTVDKLLVSLIMMTLYWKQGEKTTPGSVSNITALLFMWCGPTLCPNPTPNLNPDSYPLFRTPTPDPEHNSEPKPLQLHRR